MRRGWIGVDLDGTLAHYEGFKGAVIIGDPVPAMVKRVRLWIDAGYLVKVFTARVACDDPERGEVISAIGAWCERAGLPRLDVTNVKDFAMLELWDDRAVQVEPNTGRPIGESPMGLP